MSTTLQFDDAAEKPTVGGTPQPPAEGAQPQRTPAGKAVAEHFAAVRQRGMLNAALDGLVEQFRRNNPDLDCRWEFYNPKLDVGGTDRVINAEAMGFSVVDAKQLGAGTTSSQKEGPVRRGDLILMCGPKSLFKMLEESDAELAQTDLKAPKQAFESQLDKTAVRLPSTGESDQARATGSIRASQEEVTVELPTGDK